MAELKAQLKLDLFLQLQRISVLVLQQLLNTKR